MNTEEFLKLPMYKKLEVVNKMLEMEEKDHLMNVSKRLGIPYNSFTKLMRDNGNFHYNQSKKQYQKLMSLEEYDSLLRLQSQTKHNYSEALQFVEENLAQLKRLLLEYQEQLIIDPLVYNPDSKTINKSFQVNKEVYEEFANLCSTKFPHLRQRDIVSMCLLDFIKKYKNAPPT